VINGVDRLVLIREGHFAQGGVIATMSSNSWVLVTGANRGLGYVTAKKLVADGQYVIVGARSQASGEPSLGSTYTYGS
jgi:hypothetical protein